MIRNKKNIFEKNPIKTIIIFFLFLLISTDLVLGHFFLDDERSKSKNYRKSHHFYHHGLKSNINELEKWGKLHYELTTNSLGFKDQTNRKITKKINQYRVLFIGDSFTEGIGIDYNNTFIGILDSTYSDIEILNAGVVSYSPKLYYLKIKYLLNIINLDFNELFVFIDVSDIQDDIMYEDFKPSNKKKIRLIENIHIWFLNHSIIYNSIYWEIFYNKNFTNSGFGVWRKSSKSSLNAIDSLQEIVQENYDIERVSWSYSDSVYNKWGKLGASLATQNIKKLHNLCKKKNIKLTLGVFPRPNEIKENKLKNSKNLILWKEFCRKFDIPLINLYPSFVSNNTNETIDKYFIKGDVHWNNLGHQKIAKKIISRNYFQCKEY